MGDEKIFEVSNSPSFAWVLNNDSHPSPPLTRGRKSSPECSEKEEESNIFVSN